MRAAIYARYSSDNQNDRSIEDQVAVCSAYARSKGFEIAETFEDRALSAASTVGRLGLQRLLRAAKARGFDVLIVEHIDRLTRDQADLHTIRKTLAFAGIAIHTLRGAASAIEVSVNGMMSELFLADLAAKTHRGLEGVVRDGRHAGGRSFGYRLVEGRPGELAIDETEAAIVRRIFAEYVAGATPRAIAGRLNAEGAPSPRGGRWNASAINGSRKRLNGILANALYRGEIVWNRQSFVKDPETGKRISRPNPQSEWRRAEAPHLRIVDDDAWRAAQGAKGARGGERPHIARAPKHLFSGLLKCGRCGSGYIVSGSTALASGASSLRIVCSGRRERGDCDNGRSLTLRHVEDKIVLGLRGQLASPEKIRLFVAEFQREWRALADERERTVEPLEAERQKLKEQAGRLVDAIADGRANPAIFERLNEAEARIAAIDHALAAANAAAPAPQILPGVAEFYRKRLDTLRETLNSGSGDERAEIVAAIRGLVEKIVIHPVPNSREVDLDIHGTLAAFLAKDQKKSPAVVGGGLVGSMVAGARNHQYHPLPTFSFLVRLG